MIGSHVRDDHFTVSTGLAYFKRAAMLKCPGCGESPLFCEVRKVRGFRDWATPLEGCEKCGYRYDREPGYFLMAVWAVNYGVCGLFGVALYVAALLLQLELPQTLVMVLTPVAIANVLFARHAKACFLAFDRFVDPPLFVEK